MIDKYVTYLRDVRRYSPRTVTLYEDALRAFAQWAQTPGQAGGDGRGQAGGDVGGGVMADLIGHLIHLHMSALSGFCGFLMKEGVLKSNPAKAVKRPKMEKRLPEYYTEQAMDTYLTESEHEADADELQVLLSTASGSKLAKELYNRRLRRLIVSILYTCGIRRAELIGLQIQSVDTGRKTLRVLGKGDKMREIPLIPSLLQEISLYLHAASFMVGERPANAPLLVTDKGHALYPEFVDRAVKAELQGQSGITGRKSPHVLRHSLATALLNEGTDLNAIKQMLGHSSLAATEVYTHNSVERLKAQYMNAHPRAKNEDRND